MGCFENKNNWAGIGPDTLLLEQPLLKNLYDI